MIPTQSSGSPGTADTRHVQERPALNRITRSTDTHLKSNHRRPSFKRPEYCKGWGQDNFSYDPQYLVSYEAPGGLTDPLPKELRREVRVWQLAAAALDTGLDRVDKLYDQAIDHAFPDKTKACHLFSSPVSPLLHPENDSLPLVASALETLSLVPGSPRVYVVAHGIESPPLTPTVTNSSVISSDPDELSFKDSDSTDFTVDCDRTSLRAFSDDGFNEICWETYLGRYSAAIQDVREAKSRLNGHGRRIRTLSSELMHDCDITTKDAAANLMQWWSPLEKSSTHGLYDRVAKLKEPNIDILRSEFP